MADKYKGITLKIDGDTTNLSKALKEPQSECKTLESNLRKVEQMLKFDPKNTELLAQKQNLLNESMEATRKKLDILKQAQEEFVNSGGNTLSTEYINLQQEIQKTESRLKSLEGAGDSLKKSFADNCEAIGENLEKFGDKAQQAGSALTKGLTVPIGAIATASGVAFNELDKAYDTIASGTGATGKALEDLKKNFDGVFSNFPEEAEVVANGLADVNTRFGFTGSKLEECTKSFLTFAKVNGTDVQTAIAKVSRAMGDAGIEADEYNDILDMLTSASQSSGASVDQLAESMTKYGAPLRQLGFDSKKSLAIFAQWEKAGVNTEIAFSGLKTAISNWSSEGKDANKEFDALMQQIQKAPTLTEATTMAIEAFGKKAGPDLADAIYGGRFSVEEMMDTIKNAGGQTQATFEEMQDPIDDLKETFNTLKIAGADLANSALEMLAPYLEKLAETVKKCVEWFKGLSDGQKKTIITVGALLASIGPLLTVIGKMSTGVGAIMKAVPKIKSGLTALKGAVAGLSAPMLAVIAVVATLILAFKHLWDTNEDFRNAILGIWEQIKNTFQQLVEGIEERLNGLGISFNDIINVITALWNGFCEFLAPVFVSCFQLIADTLQFAVDTILSILDLFIALFKGDWEGVWEALKNIFVSFANFILNTLKDFWNAFKGVFSVILNWCGTSWHEFWTNVGNFFVSTWNGICSGITNFKNKLVNGVSDIISNIKSFFVNLPGQALQWGKDMIQGFIDGIGRMVGNLVDSVKGVASSIASFLHFSVPDEGPLADFDESGGDMIDLFVEGIKARQIKLQQAIQETAGIINSEMMGYEANIKTANSQTINIPIQCNLDGKPIYNNVVKRITKQSNNTRLAKGVL